MKQSKQTEQTVTIEVDIIAETDRAWLVSTTGKNRVWIPKSLAQLHEEGLSQELEMSESIAIDKGLV